jgi:hypothetical protein
VDLIPPQKRSYRNVAKFLSWCEKSHWVVLAQRHSPQITPYLSIPQGGPNAIYCVASPSRLGHRSGNHWPYSGSVDSLCGKRPNGRGVKRSILISRQDTIHEVRRSLPPIPAICQGQQPSISNMMDQLKNNSHDERNYFGSLPVAAL